MAIIPVDFGQVNYVLGGSGLPNGGEVTMGFAHSAFAGTIADAAEAFYDAFVTNVIPEMTNKVGLDHVLVKYGPVATGPSVEFGSPVLGPANVDVAPPNVTYLIIKNTPFGGRAGKGRLYLPGVPESVVGNDGSIGSGTATALQVAFTDMQTELEGVQLIPYLLHGEGSPLTTPSQIDSWSVSSLAATQRRRLRK